MRQILRQRFVEDTVPESRKATVPEKKEILIMKAFKR